MEEKEVYLSDYLRLCLRFSADPTEENYANIKAFFSKLQIRDYLPLKNKVIALTQILTSLNQNYDAPGQASQLEIGKMKYGLFSYCINLEDDCSLLTQTFSVYDEVYKNGLADYILSVCQKDYDRFCAMCSQSLDVSNVQTLAISAQIFDQEEFEKWIKRIREFKEELTPELLQGIMSLNQNGLSQVNEQLSKEAARKAMQKLEDSIEDLENNENSSLNIVMEEETNE